MRAALVQMTSSDDPAANREAASEAIARARGADLILTPEVTNCLSGSRERQHEVLRTEAEDETLPALREAARGAGAWLLIGSLALVAEGGGAGAPFVNRSFLIGPDGAVAARYDKIHMFDVDLGDGESYRESAGYRPGGRAVVAETPFGGIGLSVCYDLRFPALYRALARAGARILTVPAAFAATTGAAHWEVLLRARAIETGCFVLAPAQTGAHPGSGGALRRTHGHSLAVAPWGEVIADGGTEPGVTFADLDLSQVEAARRRVPSLSSDRPWTGPHPSQGPHPSGGP